MSSLNFMTLNSKSILGVSNIYLMTINFIQNKGLKYLLIFLIINFVNEYWSFKIGKPTLNHLFIVFLIFKFPFKYFYDQKLKLIIVPILLYIIVVFTNSIITLGKYGIDFSFVSVILKLFVFIVLAPHFIGVTRKDSLIFIKYLHISLIVFVLFPGLIEYVTQKNVMDINAGLSTSLFYLRAFTIDKVDFGFNLILLISTSTILFSQKKNIINIHYLIIIFISLYFMVLSYSSTNLIGIGLSVMFYNIFYSRNKALNLILIFLLLIGVLYATTEIQDAYLYKYSNIEAGYGENEFRSVAFFESLKLFIEHPFFGYGAESNGFLMQENISWLGEALSSHNIITEFINFGFIGAMLILFPFIFIGNYVFRIRKYKSELMFLFIMISGPLITRFLFYFHRFDKSIYIFWLSLGLILIFNFYNLNATSRNNSK